MLSKQEEEYLAKLVQKAKQMCKDKHGIEITGKIQIDTNKELGENKKAIIEAIKNEKERKLKVKEVRKSTTRAYAKKPQKSAEERKKEMEQLNKVVQEANSKIVCENKDITKHYERLRKSVEMVAKEYYNSTFLQSRTGLGKSFQVTAILNDLGLQSGKDYVEFAGDISPAYIYKFVYENNGKTIIFRDLGRLLHELRSLDMLKAMTETTPKRFVRRAIYNKDLDDLPQYFECKSRFIFEFNQLHFNGLKEDIDALLCRGDYVNLVLSMTDIADIMGQIATDGWEKEVTEFLIKNYRYVGNTLNLRTQQKAFKIYQYAQQNGGNWEEQMKIFLTSEMSNIRKLLYSLIGVKVFRSADLKRMLVLGNIDGVGSLRSADRRIQDWITLRELFVVGFITNDDEELEQYLATHKNYPVCINPIENPIPIVQVALPVVEPVVETPPVSQNATDTPQKEGIKTEA